MKKSIYITVVILVFAAVGVAAAMTINSGVITFSQLRAENMDIQPSAPPESGSLIDTLLESDFQIDEAGNVNIPNMLTFGNPPVATLFTEDAGLSWAYGIVDVTAGGAWVDSHPVEAPDGASCAIVNPYDNVFGSVITFTSSIMNQPNAYTMWPGSESCTITVEDDDVVGCVVESLGYQAGVRIRALDFTGETAVYANGITAEWQAGFSRLPFHTYSCGIVRDPSVDMADILALKLASLDASRVPDDRFFVFVKDEDGNWFNEANLCGDGSCMFDGDYRGLEVAWFVWKAE